MRIGMAAYLSLRGAFPYLLNLQAPLVRSICYRWHRERSFRLQDQNRNQERGKADPIQQTKSPTVLQWATWDEEALGRLRDFFQRTEHDYARFN
jgi:hypothetical protein